MALELIKLNDTTLPAIAAAIRAKTGDTALLHPSQMAGAIGGIRKLTVVTGSITPAADANNITIPHALSDIAAINVFADYDDVIAAGSGTIYGLRGYIRNDENFAAPNVIYYQYNGSAIAIGATRPTNNGTGGTKISVSTSLRFRAGITYHYVLYDWEET